MANITLGQFYNASREGAREGTLEAQKELFENGQAGVTLYGPNGQPISSSNRIPVEATLTGSTVEIDSDSFRLLPDGNTLVGVADDKPGADDAAAVVGIGVVYWSVDTGVVEASDGTQWVVI